MLDYKIHSENDSMYNTPPCWAIYICGLVFEKLIKQGASGSPSDSHDFPPCPDLVVEPNQCSYMTCRGSRVAEEDQRAEGQGPLRRDCCLKRILRQPRGDLRPLTHERALHHPI